MADDETKRRQLVVWLRHSADLKKFEDGAPTFACEQLNMAADLIERAFPDRKKDAANGR